MGLEEVKETTIYTKGTAHRPFSHMTLIKKVQCGSECLKEAGNQIPGDLACKTSAVGAARRSHGFSMASI
jgi:hypothetical protein